MKIIKSDEFELGLTVDSEEEKYFKKELSEVIRKAVGELKEKDCKILSMYFGIDCEPLEIDEIAAILFLNKSFTRRQLSIAILRMKNNYNLCQTLKEYL